MSFDDYGTTRGTIWMGHSVPPPPPPRSSWDFPKVKKFPELFPGDYVRCLDDIPEWNGTDDCICYKGELYKVHSTNNTSVSLTHRPGCQIARSCFEKCHLQLVRS